MQPQRIIHWMCPACKKRFPSFKICSKHILDAHDLPDFNEGITKVIQEQFEKIDWSKTE